MARKPEDPDNRRAFEDFLRACPAVDDDGADAPVRIVGMVMRTKDDAVFALQATDGTRHDIPRAAVESFSVLSGAATGRMVELTLNREALGDELVRNLGGIKSPIEKGPLDTAKEIGGGDTFKEVGGGDTLKEVGGGDTAKEQPFDTLKELGGGDTFKEVGGGDTLKEVGGGDTLKEQPFDTLKELGGGDTLKEGPADTLKEVGGGDTTKEQPFDTLKELGGGDTLKEGPTDTLKEVGGGETAKEQPFDTLKELGGGDTLKEIGGGEGTGIADTLVENIPGQPGGDLVQPELQAMQARMGGAAADLAGLGRKAIMQDTHKEVVLDQTLKELVNDPKFIKEIVKEIAKEVAWEGTGAADTLVEGRPDFGSVVNPVINPGLGLAGMQGVPFVLATPHQASQGAVAQQMLAAQALQGRLGF